MGNGIENILKTSNLSTTERLIDSELIEMHRHKEELSHQTKLTHPGDMFTTNNRLLLPKKH